VLLDDLLDRLEVVAELADIAVGVHAVGDVVHVVEGLLELAPRPPLVFSGGGEFLLRSPDVLEDIVGGGHITDPSGCMSRSRSTNQALIIPLMLRKVNISSCSRFHATIKSRYRKRDLRGKYVDH
jgi:hypothetical protein